MENNGDRPEVAALDLLSTFRQPGCPLCRIRQKAADRCLFGLLWEHMNNMDVRLRLADSLGFCPEHTWQLYRMAEIEFEGETGAPTLYQDIVRNILDHLRVLETRVPDNLPGRWRRKRQLLTPKRPCLVCDDVAAAEDRNLHWLVDGCADAAFRTRYAVSDGLCLSHLRQAVEVALQTDSNAARFLLRLSALKGEALVADLDEYIRKRAWENRLETISEAEQNVTCRAARFLGGLEQDSEAEARRQCEARVTSIEELEKIGLRIDE